MSAIYLDVSCLNRPFDDQRVARVLEAESVGLIFELFDAGKHRHVSSQMAEIEIDAIPDLARRLRVRLLLPERSRIIALNDSIYRRAGEIQKLRLKPADAIHLAAAEAANADFFLTCDDRLLRAARRNRVKIKLRVDNPLAWIKENSP